MENTECKTPSSSTKGNTRSKLLESRNKQGNSDSSDYKPRKNRKQRLVLQQLLDKYEEYHEEAEFGSTKGYTRSTLESRNKLRYRNLDEEDIEKKRSPSISPRLCTDYSPKDLDLQIEVDSSEHKPRKHRKQRLVLPQPLDKFEEYHEEAEFGKEHKLCNMKLSVKDREINRLKGISEENVSILSKDNKNIQESKRQVADEKLQDLQTENDSLKLTLAEATTKIDDLCNKCTDLQKYKSDTELEIGTLLNAVEEKETEIETLHKHLARSEKNVSILSKDIKDIQGSKRQAADEKVQSLQTENASIKLELAKATTEIDAFRNKFTNLQKYKTDTEHTIKTLLNAVKEKETEIKTLNKQLTRTNELSHKYKYLQKDKENAEHTINNLSKTVQERDKEIDSLVEKLENYDQNGRDSNEAKRERNHNLKRFNSGAEKYGDSYPEHTGLM